MNFNINYFSLKDKVIMITGANMGLGLAYAKATAALGASLVVTHFTDELEEIQAVAKTYNTSLLLWKGDLTKTENIDDLLNQVMNKYGKIDVLINNAGTIKRAPLLEFPETFWNSVIEINLNAVWHLSQKVAVIMKKQNRGKIINIASMLAFQGGKFVPSYTASKHAVAGLVKAFANELAEYNIQINAIAPGYIKTANTQPILDDPKRNAEILSRIPAGRWGETDDLMGAVIFLASEASNYVNGHILAVDGGWLAR